MMIRIDRMNLKNKIKSINYFTAVGFLEFRIYSKMIGKCSGFNDIEETDLLNIMKI